MNTKQRNQRAKSTLASMVAVSALVLGAFGVRGDELPIIEKGGTYINELIAASGPNSTITLPKGHYVLDCPVVFDKGGSVLRGATDDPRDTVLDGNGQPNNVYVKGWNCNKRLLNVTVTNVVWVNDASVALEQGGVKLEYTMISNCVVSGCRVVASAGWNRGAGIYVTGGKIIDCRIDHCGFSGTSSSVQELNGGGVYAANNSRLQDCQVVENSITSTVNKAVGYGAGVYAVGGSVSNCLVRGNVGFHVGGGVYASDSDIYATSIVSNRLTFSSWGGGISCSGTSLMKSRIEGNYSAGSAAGVDFTGSKGFRMCDCLVIGNTNNTASTAAGIHARATGGESIISNCVLAANVNAKYASAFYMGADQPSSLLFRDCWILENFGNYTVVGVNQINGSVTAQNCLFARNAVGSCFMFNPLPPGRVQVDACSFLDTKAKGNSCCIELSPTWFPGREKECVESVFICNTCVVGTANGKDYPTAFKTYSVTNCTFCYEQTGTKIPFGEDAHNISGSLDDLQFADYANGNYGIGQNSILRDAGVKSDWMGDGSKKGVKDMGDGSYTVKKVMDYGVTMSANNAHPRCFGGKVDIGCSEYKSTPGLVIMVQ